MSELNAEKEALAVAACRVCGASVTRLEAPLHAEDHAQRGEYPERHTPPRLDSWRTSMRAESLAKLICGTLSDDHPDDWDDVWMSLPSGGQAAYLRSAQAAADAITGKVLPVLAAHRPSQWNWSCTCGDMPPSDERNHEAAHREHLADMLSRNEYGDRCSACGTYLRDEQDCRCSEADVR